MTPRWRSRPCRPGRNPTPSAAWPRSGEAPVRISAAQVSDRAADHQRSGRTSWASIPSASTTISSSWGRRPWRLPGSRSDCGGCSRSSFPWRRSSRRARSGGSRPSIRDRRSASAAPRWHRFSRRASSPLIPLRGDRHLLSADPPPGQRTAGLWPGHRDRARTTRGWRTWPPPISRRSGPCSRKGRISWAACRSGGSWRSRWPSSCAHPARKSRSWPCSTRRPPGPSRRSRSSRGWPAICSNLRRFGLGYLREEARAAAESSPAEAPSAR